MEDQADLGANCVASLLNDNLQNFDCNYLSHIFQERHQFNSRKCQDGKSHRFQVSALTTTWQNYIDNYINLQHNVSLSPVITRNFFVIIA